MDTGSQIAPVYLVREFPFFPLHLVGKAPRSGVPIGLNIKQSYFKPLHHSQTLPHPLVVASVAGVKLDVPTFLPEVVVDGVEVSIAGDEGHRKSEGFVGVYGFPWTKAPGSCIKDILAATSIAVVWRDIVAGVSSGGHGWHTCWPPSHPSWGHRILPPGWHCSSTPRFLQ